MSDDKHSSTSPSSSSSSDNIKDIIINIQSTKKRKQQDISTKEEEEQDKNNSDNNLPTTSSEPPTKIAKSPTTSTIPSTSILTFSSENVSPTSSPSISSLPPNVTLRAPTKSTIPLLKRINQLLLPIPYPEKFYKDILADPETEILTRLAFYNDECVGGIRCCLEVDDGAKRGGEGSSRGNVNIPETSTILQAVRASNEGEEIFPKVEEGESSTSPQRKPIRRIYIMTLAVLAPYRSLSIGSHLLNYIVTTAANDQLIKCDEAYAHVWVANKGAFVFYEKQGFDVKSGQVVENYYRRLDPHSAKIVFKKIV